MKIVHLCQYYMPGHTYQENYLPQAMQALGHEVTVIAGTKNPGFYTGEARRNGDSLTDRGVKILYTTIHYKSLFTPVDALEALLDAEKPDLIFVHGFILTRSLELRRWAARHPAVILGADTHETFVLAFNACFSGSLKDRLRHLLYFDTVYALWRRYVERRYRKVFYVTPPRKKYAMEAFGFHEEKLESLWLGADFSDLPYEEKARLRLEKRLALDLEPMDKLLVHAGKLDQKKHTAELIEAFLKQDAPGWHLVLVGSLTPELQALADHAKETGRVHATGLVTGAEVLNYLAAADLAAYPGAHSVLWEQTAALGIPAIYYSPEAGDAEYLSDDSARFVRRGTVKELEPILKELLDPATDLAAMGLRARRHAEDTLDYAALAKKCLRVLTQEDGRQ